MHINVVKQLKKVCVLLKSNQCQCGKTIKNGILVNPYQKITWLKYQVHSGKAKSITM